MVTPVPTGQTITYHGHSTQLLKDNGNNYYVYCNGELIKINSNCIFMSQVVDNPFKAPKDTAQRQVDMRQAWINEYLEEKQIAKDTMATTQANAKTAEAKMASIMSNAGTDNYNRLNASQRAQYDEYEVNAKKNREENRLAGFRFMSLCNQITDTVFHKHNWELQVSMCDHLSNSRMA